MEGTGSGWTGRLGVATVSLPAAGRLRPGLGATTMAPEPDTHTREAPVVDLETWEKAGRAVIATVPPADEPSCDRMGRYHNSPE